MRNVLASKITIPTLDQAVIARKALHTKMLGIKKHPITVITAGAGYGKTMSLVRFLTAEKLTLAWYSMGPEDDNLYSFSVYLAAALDAIFPGLKKWYCTNLAREQRWDWKVLFYNLMAGIEQFTDKKSKGLLIIDDWQYGQGDKEISSFFNRVLAELMERIQVVLISREYVPLATVEKARIGGKVLDLTQEDFLLDTQDIQSLFAQEGLATINKDVLHNVLSKTEGWVIAVKLLLHQCQRQGEEFWQDLTTENFDSASLFAYLTQDVFSGESAQVQNFSMQASLVENFDLSFCQEICGVEKPQQWLAAMAKRGLFLSKIGKDTYRFHSLFRSFLQQQAEELLPNLTDLYGEIGLFYERKKTPDKALPFLLKGKQWRKVSKLLAEVGPHWVLSGRQKIFTTYLQQLPEDYQKNPAIYIAKGHMERITNNYDKAIQWYKKAIRDYKEAQDTLGQSHGYRSLGELYLDIIQPEQAQKYLRQAYKLLNAKQLSEKAALLYLMSENMINYGNSKRAEWYFNLWQRAEDFLGLDSNNLQARFYLRTGKINDAIQILEKKQESVDRLPCSFRESSLILSLCYTFRGDVEQATANAKESIAYAQKMQLSFAQVIGQARLGHALLTEFKNNKQQCLQAYEQAQSLADRLQVPRGKTEIAWGRCLINGLEGQWSKAQQEGLYALSITEKGHDNWFTAELYLSLSQAAGLCKEYTKTREYAKIALDAFEKCRDTLGQVAALWQLCHAFYGLQQQVKFKTVYAKLVLLSRQNECQYLLNKKNILTDITGNISGQLQQYHDKISSLQAKQKKTKLEKGLYIQTLGGLTVFRAGKEVSDKEWGRRAAKQLFMLLVTKRAHPITKEELMEVLWPQAKSKSAQVNFKVVLNYLNKLLEPGRAVRGNSRFIDKGDTYLQLRLDKDFQIDAQQFEALITEGLRQKNNSLQAEELLTEGLKLYKGEYLAGEYLDDFSLREREHLQVLAIKGAEALAELLINEKQYDKALVWCDKILALDNAWEKAYQLKIICYGEAKRTALVEKVYRTCIANLQNELGISISYSTENIYKKYS